jgi:error-prone DNA polymerase
VPIGNAAMEDRTFIEWDKDDIDALGLMKVDVLALGMLTCIRKGFDLLEEHDKGNSTLPRHPPDDPDVYDMLCRGDSIGVFQVESRAQMNMLPRLKPREFYDLVIEVAIVRPGPIQGDMVHPYLRRRNGEEEVVFPARPRTIPRTNWRQCLAAPRRASVPGTGDEDRHGAAEFTPERGQWPAPRHGNVPPCRHDPQFEEMMVEGMVEAGL